MFETNYVVGKVWVVWKPDLHWIVDFVHVTLQSPPAETESHEGKRKVEALWPIFK